MSTMDYLNFSVTFLKGTGLLPSSILIRKLIASLIFLPIVLVLTFLAMYKFRSTKGDIILMAEAFESLSTFTQLTVRKVIFIAHGKLIEEIINDCNQQWKYDKFGKEAGIKFRKNMEFCIKLIKTLFFTSVATVTLMGVAAILDDDKPIPLMCWIPDIKWAREIIFISEMFILIETVYYVIATESFYLLLGMDLQIQYGLMGEMLKTIKFGEDDDHECLKKLVECTQHHKLLLRIHQKLNRVFSEYFIVQYGMTVAAVSIQLYLALYTSLELVVLLKSVSYFCSVMLQIALYFIPAGNMETKAENFSLDVYFVNWEANKNSKISKDILFMLMKSQKSLVMYGGGMLRINRQKYIGIVRLGFSIATILGGLKE